MSVFAAFRQLHHADRVLLLPNAWDAASAALFRSAGAEAIATTSAGLAWACGFPDGDALPRESLLVAVGEICRVTGELPVSADVEGGYSSDPREAADLVTALAALGVAGINLEDGAGSPDLLVAKIEAIKRACASAGRDVFINARTDIYLRGLATGDAALREVLARAERYAKAGADGFFVPAVTQAQAIRAIASATPLPLNVLAVPGLPTVAQLYELGVRRLSAGSWIAKLAFGAGLRAAQAFARDADVEALFRGPAIDYDDMNDLLQPSSC